MKQVIHIQICKGYKKGTLRFEIGDIEGSIGIYNATKKEVLSDIADEIDKLKNIKEKGHTN